jgi:branched-chain amino acid transport system permease protein
MAVEELPATDVLEPAPPGEDDGRDEAAGERRFRPSPLGWAGRGAAWGLLAWVVLAYPVNALSPFTVESLEAQHAAQAVVFAIIGLSLNVLLGYAGQISLGHQAFVGIGAFTSAYMVTKVGQDFYLAVLVAAGVGALQAAVLGGVALRVTGLYFALVTLSYGILAEDSLFNIQSLTGGQAGIESPRPTGFESNYRYYYLCLAFLAVVLWLDWRMMRTKGGRALLALRENPRVAATLGINVKAFTLFAFAVSGAFAGVGGALFGHLDPTVVSVPFSLPLALVFVAMTTVGGLRSRSGVIISSAVVALLDELVEMLGQVPILRMEHRLDQINLPVEFAPIIFLPILVLLTLTLYPGGIGQGIAPVRQWLAGRRFDLHVGAEKEVQVTDVRA